MQKILVFGATGNIGGATTTALAAKGTEDQLRLASHRPDGRDELASRYPTAGAVAADFGDVDSLVAALNGIERVFMNVPDMTPEPAATENLLTAARGTDRPPIIVRFGAFPPGKTLASLTPATRDIGIGAAKHLRARITLEGSGMPYVILNAPCWFMSNLPWLSGQALRERDEIVIPAQMRTAWIASEDIGEAAAAILTDAALCQPGRVFDITGPEMLDYDGVAAIMSEVLGRKIRYNGDVEVFRSYFGEMTDPMTDYFENSRHDYDRLQVTDELEPLLGRRPTTLAQWLATQRAAFE
jgi:uncharacterized protein YbjT (DUF2867 family)